MSASRLSGAASVPFRLRLVAIPGDLRRRTGLRLASLGIDPLGQVELGLGDVGFRRVVADEAFHQADAAEKPALVFQETGHAALAGEAAFDGRPAGRVAPLDLADLAVGPGSGQQLFERYRLLGPLLLDCLAVLHQLGRAESSR